MIAGNLDHLNKMFVDVEHKPISFGIGIHGGEVIAGDIGYRDQIVFSVIGDTVGVVGHLLPAAEVAIRGRADPLLVRGIEKAAMLATVLQDPDAAEAKPGAAMVPKKEEITSGL